MNPSKIRRENVHVLTDLPNIGEAMAADFRLMGYKTPEQLTGCDGYQLYRRLCELTQIRHDPCVLDIFLSVADFMAGNPPKLWWHYTEQRKRQWPSL